MFDQSQLKLIENELSSLLGSINGTDTNGRSYSTLESLWKLMFRKGQPKASWYDKASSYWDNEGNCPGTDDGVLGGFGFLTPADVAGSNDFLDKLCQSYPKTRFDHVVDCGAGIGRVTKNLLLSRSEHVSLVEQSSRLLSFAAEYIGPAPGKTIEFIHQGLQDYSPGANSVDLVWIQWVVGHLNDTDFVQFFRRCKSGLKANGVIVVKDNAILDRNLTFCIDLDDSSVARHLEYLRILFREAGLRIVLEQEQRDFPSELYPVFMIALVPME